MINSRLVLEDGLVRFTGSHYAAWAENYRDGSAIIVENESSKARKKYFCSQEERPLTERDVELYGPQRCPFVIVWRIAWSMGGDAVNLEGTDKNLREFLEEFAQMYQRAGGIGCVVDGVIHKALVEVYFGR